MKLLKFLSKVEMVLPNRIRWSWKFVVYNIFVFVNCLSCLNCCESVSDIYLLLKHLLYLSMYFEFCRYFHAFETIKVISYENINTWIISRKFWEILPKYNKVPDYGFQNSKLSLKGVQLTSNFFLCSLLLHGFWNSRYFRTSLDLQIYRFTFKWLKAIYFLSWLLNSKVIGSWSLKTDK